MSKHIKVITSLGELAAKLGCSEEDAKKQIKRHRPYTVVSLRNINDNSVQRTD